MSQIDRIATQEENDLQKVVNIFSRNYKLFIACMLIAIGAAFLVNRYTTPIYKVSASILIKENSKQQRGSEGSQFLNSGLFGVNQNFQNELWVLQSTPVLEQTIRNLDLSVIYYKQQGLKFLDFYKDVPFKVFYLKNHSQPVNIRFELKYLSEGYFQIKTLSTDVYFYNFETDHYVHQQDRWVFNKNGRFGELIETEDLAFVIETDNTQRLIVEPGTVYAFEFRPISTLKQELRENLNFFSVDKLSTVIEISLISESVEKGIDIVNELMSVYSEQNLERKNHIATITIDYIEKQLNEISDSLNLTEDKLQWFRSTNQVLNISDQANNISTQYSDLQNQLAVLVTRKRYYDYVSEYLAHNDNFSNMIVPASLGIQDQLLNNLMSQLIAAQAQLSGLIMNNQDKNPLVSKLNMQIDNVKKTISENISAVSKTTLISLEEMHKRITKLEDEISRMPFTQRKLGNIERKYRLNDAIYNYMLEKRAEAKITKASNLPDDLIIEPAAMVGLKPISPNGLKNYLISILLGIVIPFLIVSIKQALSNKIEELDTILKLTNEPLIGKILHFTLPGNNVMFANSKSSISESFRALRTNLELFLRDGNQKVVMITSSIEKEGKTFITLNLAMSYSQLGRKTIIVDFDMRKPEIYFDKNDLTQPGLSSYLTGKISIEEIIIHSPYENLDYINSGLLPPNPVELIAGDKTKALITQLKRNYDIIILDTTPLAQVTDAYLLFELADIKLVVTRQGFSLKKAFSLVMKDLQNKNISNIRVVLNDNKLHSEQFAYGYGYNNISNKHRKTKYFRKI
jgi:tyrosine-protein kinase Etk/Wzc